MRRYLTGRRSTSTRAGKGAGTAGRNRGATRSSAWLLSAAALGFLVLFVFAPATGAAGNAGASLDQCGNGSVVTNNSGDCSSTNNAIGGWQNGDLQSGNSHFREGDSVPFRIIFTGLSAATTYKAHIAWQATNTPAQHAYDYLTTYNRTIGSANPCSTTDAPTGFSCTGLSSSTFPITADPTLNCPQFTGSQGSQNFTLWGVNPGGTSLSSYDLGSGCPSTAANTDNGITITFTTAASATTVVIAWGGHIASSIDWGPGHSAGSISGSPYHMALTSCTGLNCGSQDRALKASAVLPEPNVATQVNHTQITLGSSVTDHATLTGSGTNPPTVTGTVDFVVCGPTASPTPCATGGTAEGTGITLVNGQADSSSFQPGAVGYYCFRLVYHAASTASYSSTVSTSTTNECVQVIASPTIGTTVSESTGGTGDSISDSASLSGTSNLDGTGSVTFYLFAPGVTCNVAGTGSVYSQTDTGVSTNGPFASGSFGPPLVAGTYHWLAVFSGDGNNSGANSGCTSEPVTITAPHVSQITPTNTTCQQFQSGTAGTLSSIQYSLKGKTGSQTINQVNPGVFFYWVNVTTKTSGPPYTITQTLSADTLTTKFLLASGSFAYDANCNVIKNATITQGSNGTVTVNGSGIVFIGLKYSTSAVVGKAAPNPATVTYTFNTTQVPSSSRSIDLVKK